MKPFQVMRMRTPPSAGGDPFFSSVATLLHFDGANNSTTFTCVKGRPYTANGSAALKTAQFKFGTASLGNGGTGSPFISTPINAALALSTSSFTMEMWLYVPSSIVSAIGLSFYVVGGGLELSITSGNKVNLAARSIGTRLTSSTNFPRDQWVHLAVVRSGSTGYIFQDGVQVATGSVTDNFGNATLQIGAVDNSSWYLLGGFIDEYRLTIGVARYTSGFTPPTAAFPDF